MHTVNISASLIIPTACVVNNTMAVKASDKNRRLSKHQTAPMPH